MKFNKYKYRITLFFQRTLVYLYIMNIKYFKDTDTLLVNFNNNNVSETKDLNENVLLDLDKDGNVVSITLEHARQQTEISSFSFDQVDDLSVDESTSNS